MTVKFSATVRNNLLDSIETSIGPSARLIMYSGTPPEAITDAATGTVVTTMVLPADWMSTASAGAKTLNGVWTSSATATAVVGYYRIWDSTVTVAHEQGTVTITGGGGDMTLDNPSASVGQTITILTKTLTSGGA